MAGVIKASISLTSAAIINVTVCLVKLCYQLVKVLSVTTYAIYL